MTKEVRQELYKLFKNDGELIYGCGKFPVSIGWKNEKHEYNFDILKNVNVIQYDLFRAFILFCEEYKIDKLTEWLNDKLNILLSSE